MAENNTGNGDSDENDLAENDLDQEGAPDPASETDEEPSTAVTPPDADSSRSRARAGAVVTRAVVKRIIGKYAQLADAHPADVAVLAGLLGVGCDPEEVTAAIITGRGGNLVTLTHVAAVAETGNGIEAMVAVLGLEKTEQRKIWSLLEALGQITGSVPAKESAAAAKIASTIIGLDASVQKKLGALRDLARK